MSNETYKSIWQQVVELVKLYITGAKLTVSEKAATLLSTGAVCALIFVLGIVAFFFLSMAAVHWISQGVGLDWAYLIMAGFYVLLIVLILVFRKPLIVDRVARFISRLLLS